MPPLVGNAPPKKKLVLPTTMLHTPVPSQDGSRRLNCLIECESIVFLVTVGRDYEVSDLKEVIQSK